jgi:RimJ/RimL family protein N-acetyltransferase
MIIRQVEHSDEQSLIRLLESIDGESTFMLYEKNEREFSPEQTEVMISSFAESANSTFLIAEENSLLTGFIMAYGGKANRNKHTASLVIAVLQQHARKGIGTKLMRTIENWAHEVGVTRLELTTMVHNEAALALYKKTGYEVEGLKRNSFMIDGKSVDEYYLAKLLN